MVGKLRNGEEFMQCVRIQVVRGRAYRSTDGWQVCGGADGGGIDWDHPLTSRRMPFWPDAMSVAGHLSGGHALGPHLDSVRPDGHLEGTHLLDEHSYPAAAMEFEVGPFVFGRFRFAVVTEDAFGNVMRDGVVVHSCVVNSSPLPAFDLRPTAQDRATGRMSFSFTPSERLVG